MITVIGAGPAGLAVSWELRRRSLAHVVLERGSVGEAWRHHYDRLRLHTLKEVSSLPGLPLPASAPTFVSRAAFLAYLRDYVRRHALPVEERVALRRADWDGREWRLDTTDGGRAAAVLVMATGIWSAPVWPAIPGVETFGGEIIHSRHYRNPRPFRGKRVLVVGVGNSGSEIAVDLAEHGGVAVAVRGGAAFVGRPRSAAVMRVGAWLLRRAPWLDRLVLARRDFGHLGLPLPPGRPIRHYPVVGYELPEAAADGRVRVYAALTRLSPGTAHFADGCSAPFDAIILATGYRPALDPVAHELDVDERGRPLLDRRWRSRRNPRLVCVGYTYPTTEGWIQAIGRVAREAADGIAEVCGGRGRG